MYFWLENENKKQHFGLKSLQNDSKCSKIVTAERSQQPLRQWQLRAVEFLGATVLVVPVSFAYGQVLRLFFGKMFEMDGVNCKFKLQIYNNSTYLNLQFNLNRAVKKRFELFVLILSN